VKEANKAEQRVRRVWFAFVVSVVLLFAIVGWRSGSAAKRMATVAASNEQDLSRSAVASLHQC
jgi:hypothetical protein